jgi:hypothetical protein
MYDMSDIGHVGFETLACAIKASAPARAARPWAATAGAADIPAASCGWWTLLHKTWISNLIGIATSF